MSPGSAAGLVSMYRSEMLKMPEAILSPTDVKPCRMKLGETRHGRFGMVRRI